MLHDAATGARHAPIQHLKRSAGAGGPDHVAMVRQIFGLDPGDGEAPSRKTAGVAEQEEPHE